MVVEKQTCWRYGWSPASVGQEAGRLRRPSSKEGSNQQEESSFVGPRNRQRVPPCWIDREGRWLAASEVEEETVQNDTTAKAFAFGKRAVGPPPC